MWKLNFLRKFMQFCTRRLGIFPQMRMSLAIRVIKIKCWIVPMWNCCMWLEGWMLIRKGCYCFQVMGREKEKEYEVWLASVISDEDCNKLEEWVILDDGYLTKPAKVQKIEDKKILLTITEWKYHQVKRMLEAVGNKVVYLKRLRIGEWNLDGLKPGEWKMIEK